MSKISLLPTLPEAEIDGSEIVPVVHEGANYQASLNALTAPVLAAAEAASATASEAAALAIGVAHVVDSEAEGLASFANGDVFTVSVPGSGLGDVFRKVAGAASFRFRLITSALLASINGASLVGASAGGTVQDNLTSLRNSGGNIRALMGGDGDITATIVALRNAGFRRAFLDRGSYTLVAGVDLDNLIIHAHPEAEITVTGANVPAFSSTGSLTALAAALSADPVKAGRTLTFGAAHGLQPGDVGIVYNPVNGSYNNDRPYYRAGEWIAVSKNDSATVARLTSPLYAGYTAAAMTVYKANLKSPRIIGGKWKVGNRALLAASLCTGKLLDITSLDADTNAAVSLDRCYGVHLDMGVTVNRGNSSGAGATDDYGVAVGNSQIVRVTGRSIWSRRHAVAHGGADVIGSVPCRDCYVDDTVLDNDTAANIYALDFHGNSEDCGARNSRIARGIALGGMNLYFRNCELIGRTDGCIAEASEYLGGDLWFIDCRFSTPRSGNASRGFIDIGTSGGTATPEFGAKTKADINLVVRGGTFTAPNITSGNVFCRILNAGATTRKLNVQITELEVSASAGFEVLRTDVQGGGTALSDGIIIDRIRGLPSGSALHVAIGSFYRGFPSANPEIIVTGATGTIDVNVSAGLVAPGAIASVKFVGHTSPITVNNFTGGFEDQTIAPVNMVAGQSVTIPRTNAALPGSAAIVLGTVRHSCLLRKSSTLWYALSGLQANG